jgi:hypothetical protein
MPLRAAAICGLLVPVTVSIAYIGGALAQPDAYSSADDATSDLGRRGRTWRGSTTRLGTTSPGS